MNNSFNRWNEVKKHINKNEISRFYHENEIWWCNLGLNIGSEQNGGGPNYERPILIIKSLSRGTFFALPLTKSTSVHNKYRINIGPISNKNATVILSQMRITDSKRLTKRICKLDNHKVSKIKKAIKKMF